MFHSLFNPENTFWRWMAGLADILVLSVLWLLCSVPVVTVGAATAALYDACARGMRGGRGDAWRRFFHTFRAELKTATIACAIWEALLLVLFWVLRRLWAAALAGVSGSPREKYRALGPVCLSRPERMGTAMPPVPRKDFSGLREFHYINHRRAFQPFSQAFSRKIPMGPLAQRGAAEKCFT